MTERERFQLSIQVVPVYSLSRLGAISKMVVLKI